MEIKTRQDSTEIHLRGAIVKLGKGCACNFVQVDMDMILHIEALNEPSSAAKEETCKWKKVLSRVSDTLAEQPHQMGTAVWNFAGLNYCPYCGKKIEVVE
jgi:hypothetical protein